MRGELQRVQFPELTDFNHLDQVFVSWKNFWNKNFSLIELEC